MINGTAMILVLAVCSVTAYCAFAIGYERGKADGYFEGVDNGYADAWEDLKSSNLD